jgi:hypothetical protein
MSGMGGGGEKRGREGEGKSKGDGGRNEEEWEGEEVNGEAICLITFHTYIVAGGRSTHRQ